MLRSLGILLCCGLALCGFAAERSLVVFLGGGNDSDLAAEAFAGLNLPEQVSFEYYCTPMTPMEKIRERARHADVLIINSLVRELRELAAKDIDYSKTKLYAFSSRRLPKNIPALEPPELQAYRANRRPVNFHNMILWIVNREFDPSVKFAPPLTLPRWASPIRRRTAKSSRP